MPIESLSQLKERMSPIQLAELEGFNRRRQRSLERITRTPLVILVWGPGPGDSTYQKRVELQETLTSLGHVALFSEWLGEDEQDQILLFDEFAQADAADLILVLTTSWGPLTEKLYYGRDPKIAQKMWAYVHERAKEGFVGAGPFRDDVWLREHVVYFTDVEFHGPGLIDRILECVRAYQFEKYRQRRKEVLGDF